MTTEEIEEQERAARRATPAGCGMLQCAQYIYWLALEGIKGAKKEQDWHLVWALERHARKIADAPVLVKHVERQLDNAAALPSTRRQLAALTIVADEQGYRGEKMAA